MAHRTRKSFAAALALALCLTFALSASAKDDRSQFIDFTDQIIKGELQRPTAILFNGRDKIRFKRLLVLKKSFHDQFATAHMSPTLK